MSREQQVHKNWCDLMVARAKENKRKADYPYKLMMWKGEQKWKLSTI